ncbi:MAG: acyl-CoA dehydrogenase family protein [Janthinobacterium lividum]
MDLAPERPDSDHFEMLWDAEGSSALSEVFDRIRPILEDIRRSAVAAEAARTLPFEPIASLKTSGFTSARIPCRFGGLGLSLTDLFELVTALAAADSNIAQALRAHFGYVEHLLFSRDEDYQARWMNRLGRGETAGAAAAEKGGERQQFRTTLTERNGTWLINGTKFFTTGSLYADWLTVTATDADGETVKCIASRRDPGLEIVDDWDGFGQRLTASGTAHFSDVRAQDNEIRRGNADFPYSQAFFQLYHLATAAGIAQAALRAVAEAVRDRKRSFTHGNSDQPAQDPQVLELVGKVSAAAYSATATVRQAARALEAAAASGETDRGPASIRAELQVWQAQEIVFPMTLEATTLLFDALGGTATLRPAALDRFWRNIRTIACHNPRVFRTRIVGDFAVSQTPPPEQWRVGDV